MAEQVAHNDLVVGSIPTEPTMPTSPRLKPVLIGEANPYGGSAHFALYPSPDGCSGHRLCCKIFGMRRMDYLHEFERADLCPQHWSMTVARESVKQLLQRLGYSRFILLGSKVCTAFGVPYKPFMPAMFSSRHKAVILPHPSGLCRLWDDPSAIRRARDAVAAIAPEVSHLFGVNVEEVR